MSPRNPTPARIEAAKLLKRLNDIDHLPTDADVLELAALSPDDFEPRRLNRQAQMALAKERVTRHLQENLEVLEKVGRGRVGYFGSGAVEYELVDVPDFGVQEELFEARRAQDA